MHRVLIYRYIFFLTLYYVVFIRSLFFVGIRVINLIVFVIFSLSQIVDSSQQLQPPRFTTQPSSSGSIVSEGRTKILQCHALGKCTKHASVQTVFYTHIQPFFFVCFYLSTL